MKEEMDFKNTEVAIAKGDTLKSTVLNGIEILGGISKFIKEGDQVFIKFNLCFPTSFPTDTNLDLLETLIFACKEARAGKIFLGTFPFKSISMASISSSLNLDEFFRTLGAEFIYLDNSNMFHEKKINKNQLEKIAKDSFSRVMINEKEFLAPKVILKSDKLIIVNQINVDPVFKLSLSLLNSYSIVPPKFQEIEGNSNQDNNYLLQDQYKQNLISNILDVFTVKQPNLVINDLFYVLEGAGPCIYKDSNLKKPGIMVIGNNAVTVDLITLKLLNIDTQDYKLLLEAHQRGLGILDHEKITLLGEDIENSNVSVDLCASKLRDIKIKNFSINSGKMCSGCFKQAYHLLNFMKTYMTKDLKYNPRNAFLTGLNPDEPNRFENVILFGDCAIRSTKNNMFRERRIVSKKPTEQKKNSKKTREKGLLEKEKIKTKTNKRILEMPGCPPDIIDCLEMIKKYYGKKNLPNLSFLSKLLEYLVNSKVKTNLSLMGVI